MCETELELLKAQVKELEHDPKYRERVEAYKREVHEIEHDLRYQDRVAFYKKASGAEASKKEKELEQQLSKETGKEEAAEKEEKVLRVDLSQQRQREAKAEEEEAELKKDLSQEKEEVEEAEEEAKELKGDLKQQASKDEAEEEEKEEKLKSELAEQKEKEKEGEEEEEELKKEEAQEEEEKQEAEKEAETLKADLGKERKEEEAAEEAEKELKEDLKSESEAKEKAKEEEAELKERLNSESEDEEKAKAESEALAGDLSRQREKGEEAEEEEKELQEDLSKLTDKKEEVEREEKELSQELSSKTAEGKEAEGREQELEGEKSYLEDEIKTLRSKKSDLEEQLLDHRTSLRKQQDELVHGWQLLAFGGILAALALLSVSIMAIVLLEQSLRRKGGYWPLRGWGTASKGSLPGEDFRGGPNGSQYSRLTRGRGAWPAQDTLEAARSLQGQGGPLGPLQPSSLLSLAAEAAAGMASLAEPHDYAAEWGPPDRSHLKTPRNASFDHYDVRVSGAEASYSGYNQYDVKVLDGRAPEREWSVPLSGPSYVPNSWGASPTVPVADVGSSYDAVTQIEAGAGHSDSAQISAAVHVHRMPRGARDMAFRRDRSESPSRRPITREELASTGNLVEGPGSTFQSSYQVEEVLLPAEPVAYGSSPADVYAPISVAWTTAPITVAAAPVNVAAPVSVAAPVAVAAPVQVAAPIPVAAPVTVAYSTVRDQNNRVVNNSYVVPSVSSAMPAPRPPLVEPAAQMPAPRPPPVEPVARGPIVDVAPVEAQSKPALPSFDWKSRDRAGAQQACLRAWK